MTKRNSVPKRVDPRFDLRVKQSAIKRVNNEIDNEIRSSAEMTEMMMNAPSMEKVFNELETIPRKGDLRKLRR